MYCINSLKLLPRKGKLRLNSSPLQSVITFSHRDFVAEQCSGVRQYISVARPNEYNSKKYQFCAPFSSSSSLPLPEEASNVTEMQERAVAKYASQNLLGTKVGGKFEWITYAEFQEQIGEIRKVLHNNFGIKENEAVALICNNRVEWAASNYAINSLRAHTVPMYEVQPTKDWEHIVNDSETKVLFCATEEIYHKVKGWVGTLGKLQHVVCFDADESKPYSLKSHLKSVKDKEAVPSAAVDKEDLAVIIYTSGTTGLPKGVELTHANIIASMKGCSAYSYFIGERSLAFLPWSHVYGMTSELHSMVCLGNEMAIVNKREELLESLQLAKPSVILSVPSLFNRIYDGVQIAFSKETGVKKWLIKKAFEVSREKNHAEEFSKPVGPLINLQAKIFDKLVFSKIRDKFGGNLTMMCNGGAALSMEVLKFFEDIGIPVVNGYGLTETSPIISCSTKGNFIIMKSLKYIVIKMTNKLLQKVGREGDSVLLVNLSQTFTV